jgi:UDP-glucose 4-epimerase
VILLRQPMDAGTQLVAVFGVGLIGSALVDALEARGAVREGRHAIAWEDPRERAAQLASIEGELAATLHSRSCETLQVIWAAGRCGFSASEEEASAERASFEEAAAMLEAVARRSPGVALRFLLISTAGGLFEGQRRVDGRSSPTPARPYGRLKLGQEQRIQAEGVPWRPEIVRLTSVVGPARAGQRRGLISTLVQNGLRQQPTRIVGRMETLRDFVWVEDVASFVARRIGSRGDSGADRVVTLASAKPSSLAEVQRLVEKTLGRRIYVSYSLAPSNDVDITFSPSLRPPGWQPCDLVASVRRVHRDALARGATA